MGNSNLEFNCLTNTNKGFILGGNRGCICIYEIEKNYSIVNTMSFEMKTPTNDDNKIYFLSSTGNNSIISIVSNESQPNVNYHLLNTY